MRAASFFALAALGCARGGERGDRGDRGDVQRSPASEAALVEPAPAASVEASSAALRGPPRTDSDFLAPHGPSAGEARRSVLAALEGEPLLRPQLATLRAHFGPSARGPYAMQRIELAGGRTAVLINHPDETEPIVLGLDRDQLVWSRPRPTAGIAPALVHLALAPRADGGVALFGYVASMHLVASRMWAEDGSPFADLQVFSPASCDALSAAYAPRQGWVVACTSSAGVRAQRVRGDGTIAWGEQGASLGTHGVTGPLTIAFDTPFTSVVLQRARGVGGDHLLVSRYDADGLPLWPAPVDVGCLPGRATPPERAPEDRFVAASFREGLVRVELPRGLQGRRAQAAEIGSAGEVHLVNGPSADHEDQ